MVTSFPPRILVCIDAKYAAPRAYISEDALQLYVDELALQDKDAGWDTHDIYDDQLVRATLVKSEAGITALYKAKLPTGQTVLFEVEQFNAQGAASVKQLES